VDARLISRKALGIEEQLDKLFPYVMRRASLLVIFDVPLRTSPTDNNFGFSWWYNCALPLGYYDKGCRLAAGVYLSWKR
jgi:hypothetical protein